MTSSVKETEPHKKVRMAIVKIEKDENLKMSVSAVARMAGVSRNIIYRDCPDLITRIEGALDKGIRKQLRDKQAELNEYKERNKDLREELKEMKEINAYLQSKNATLIDDNKRLKRSKETNGNIVPIR